PNDSFYVWMIPLAALFFGLLLGIYAYRSNRNRIENTLLEYIQTLDSVAAGDLRARLILPTNDQSRESQILRHLGQATNRTLGTLQDVVKDFSEALHELEVVTLEILNATG